MRLTPPGSLLLATLGAATPLLAARALLAGMGDSEAANGEVWAGGVAAMLAALAAIHVAERAASKAASPAWTVLRLAVIALTCALILRSWRAPPAPSPAAAAERRAPDPTALPLTELP